MRPVGQRPRLALAVDGHIGQRGLGHLHHLPGRGVALGPDLDVHGHRGAAHARDAGVEAQQVAHRHRLLEHELVDRHGGDAALRHAHRQHGAGQVHLRHDPAAEDVAVGVAVARHRDHAQHQLGVLVHTRGPAQQALRGA